MTNKEAIEILKRNKPTSDPRRCGKELCAAVDKAIEALENNSGKKMEKNGMCNRYSSNSSGE